MLSRKVLARDTRHAAMKDAPIKHTAESKNREFVRVMGQLSKLAVMWDAPTKLVQEVSVGVMGRRRGQL